MEKNNGQPMGTPALLKQAFKYWNAAMLYHLVFSLLYFSLFFMGYFYLFKYFGFWEEIMKHSELMKTDLPAFNKKIEEVARMPQARNFSLAFFGLLALLNPLNAGLYEIYSKIDRGETPQINDLFAGYRGFAFFKFFGFYLFWIIIYSYANATIILGFVWLAVTVFSVPLLYFRNTGTFDGIRRSVNALKTGFGIILPCMLAAALFSLSGVILLGAGLLLTFPFWHTMTYTLYRNFFPEAEPAAEEKSFS